MPPRIFYVVDVGVVVGIEGIFVIRDPPCVGRITIAKDIGIAEVDGSRLGLLRRHYVVDTKGRSPTHEEGDEVSVPAVRRVRRTGQVCRIDDDDVVAVCQSRQYFFAIAKI